MLENLRGNGREVLLVAQLLMSVPEHLYIPVSPSAGGEVHATMLNEPDRTVCGRKFRGWIVHPDRLSCKRCKELIHHPVSPGKTSR